MAGSPEGDKRGFVEKASTGVRNAGILAAVLGTILLLTRIPVGETIFWGGAALGVTGEAGRRAAGGK